MNSLNRLIRTDIQGSNSDLPSIFKTLSPGDGIRRISQMNSFS